jgi:PAS domain S-box-containing protein
MSTPGAAGYDAGFTGRGSAALEAGELAVLELVAIGAPLEETLDALARLFESEAEGMLASILAVKDGKVRHVAAPTLPRGWAELVDGQPIGPNQGSCGTAAYLKEPVMVADIATDRRWQAYRDAALGFGLRACWSMPIFGPEREVFGTFAFYYGEPREPTPRLLALASRASKLATVAFQRHRHLTALEQSQQHLALVYNHSSDVHFEIDVEPDGYRFVSVNPAFIKATGLTAEQVVGKLVHEVIPEPSLSLVLDKYAQAIRTKTTVRWDEVTPYPTGLKRGDVAITPVFDEAGQARHLIGSVRDMTAQYELLVDVSQLRQTEAELRHALEELQESYGKLSKLEELRDDLVHMIVHDMRSPLTALQGHLGLLEESAAGALTVAAREDLSTALRAARVVNEMANELLDVSRLEQGKLPLALGEHDLGPLAADVCHELGSLEPGRKLELDVPGQLLARYDDRLVRRVIENLVSNAVKHTPAAGRIWLSLAARGDRIRLSVADEGAGIAPEARARIFEKFGRVTGGAPERFHSAGLGLAFSKLAIEAHGGSIGLDAREPRGSVFWFELPR